MKSLYKKLREYAKLDYYPFHMPGHKRNEEVDISPYDIDITEIDGFDNLHHPEDIIKKEMELAAATFGSKQSYFLVNGSTVGILSSIYAALEKGETLLMSRNSHKAVYNGVYLRELGCQYVYPQQLSEIAVNGGICPQEIEKALKSNSNIKAVLVTSPTYEGVVSDIKRIADIVHQYNKILIVDEAHGAHFGFHLYFPKSAVECGADLVIQSLHKTLPTLTQTAILHVNGDLVDNKKVEKYLGIFQTSSPSYVLMASISKCVKELNEKKDVMFTSYVHELDSLRKSIERLNNIRLLTEGVNGECNSYDLDRSKLIIYDKTNQYSGKELYDILLEKYHLQMEMCVGEYVIAMTAINDTSKGFERLYFALKEIDDEIEYELCKKRAECGKEKGNRAIIGENKQEYSINETESMPFKKILLKDSVNQISKEYIYLYPPGIPLVVPGERINTGVLAYIIDCKKNAYSIQGLVDFTGEYINIVDMER